MIKNIHSTTIIVADQDVSLDFYVNKLGWEKRTDAMMGPDFRFLTVAPIGAETELVLGPASAYGVKPGGGIENGISLNVENFDETYQTLVSRGVRFTKPPEVMPWGDKGTWMLDPDGNSLFLAGR